MVRPVLLVSGFVVFVVVAYYAGRQFASVEAAPPAATRVVERIAVQPATTRLHPEDLRALVAEIDRQPAVTADDQVQSPTERPTEALAIVEAGIRDGTWSASERDTLRAKLVDLRPAEIDEVLSPLFQAINAQRVRLDGPPI